MKSEQNVSKTNTKRNLISAVKRATVAMLAAFPALLAQTQNVFAGNSTTNIGTYFTNAKNTLTNWGGAFIAFLGVVLIIIAVVMLVKAFISHGRGQTNWIMIILMILVGAGLAAGGIGFMTGLGNQISTTLGDLGCSS